MTVSSQSVDNKSNEVVDWSDLGQRMWTFLTGREAAINYTFRDMTVETPRHRQPGAASHVKDRRHPDRHHERQRHVWAVVTLLDLSADLDLGWRRRTGRSPAPISAGSTDT